MNTFDNLNTRTPLEDFDYKRRVLLSGLNLKRPSNAVTCRNDVETLFVPENLMLDKLVAQSRLYEKAIRRVILPAALAGRPITPLGFAPIFDEPRLISSANCTWLLGPLETDPLWLENIKFHLPVKELKVIQKMANVGVNPDRLYLAHELAPDTASEISQVTAEALRPGLPTKTVRWVNRLGKISELNLKIAAAPLYLASLLTLGTARVGEETVKSLTKLSVALDPVLFGAVTLADSSSSAGTLALWFELARWEM